MQIHNGKMKVSGATVPFTLTKLDGSSNKLVILLPAKGYSTQGPLFWYSRQIYLNQGFDTLELHFSIRSIAEEDLPMVGNKLIISFLREQEYDVVHFVSMGIGSTIAAHFLTHQVYPNIENVWLSPYLDNQNVLQALLNRPNRGLVLLGEFGEFIEEEGADLVEEMEHLTVAHVTGAYDSLETPYPELNISTIRSIIQLLDLFIQKQEIILQEKRTRVKVYFRLFGDDFPLEEVTEKLGQLPTKTYKKGERIVPPIGIVHGDVKRVYPETGWELGTEYMESVDLEIPMDQLISKLKSKVFVINELRHKYDLKSFIQVVLYIENGETTGMTLTKKALRFANQIKTEYVDIDIYPMPYDENLRFESDGIIFKGRKLSSGADEDSGSLIGIDKDE